VIDLVDEFLAARERLSETHRAALLKAGIPAAQIDIWGWHGISAVRLGQDGLYQPTDGKAAIISAVRGFPDGSIEYPHPEMMLYLGDIIDLIAWHPKAPERWALRTGAATAIGIVEPQLLDPAPVHVRRHPLGWFRSGGNGICLLTRDLAEQRHLLLQIHRLVAEDVAHGRAIRDVLTRPLWTPQISVPATDDRRVA
jgi:hypothetical protein